jgi:hypothetical protein
MKGITMNTRKDERQTQRNRVWRNIIKTEGNSEYKNDKGVKRNLNITMVKNDK